MKNMKKLLVAFTLLLGWGLASAQVPNCGGVTASFSFTSPQTGYYSFTSTTTSTPNFQIQGYEWNFGDSTTSTLQNPTHQFSDVNGTYQVCLIVAANVTGQPTNICKDTFCTTVSPCANMVVATFSAVTNGNLVTFNGLGNGNAQPLSYLWTFGDGSSGQGQNPVHTYTNSGTYSVCLFVTDVNGCVGSYCQPVTVTAPNNCGNVQANFTVTNTSPGVVVLQSTSTNVNTGASFQWWMNGSPLTNTPTSNTSFTVNNLATGVYSFCLYVYSNNNQAFCGSICSNVTVNGGGNPCLNFSANITQQPNPNGGGVYLTANVTGATPGTQPTFAWSNAVTTQSTFIQQTPSYLCVTISDAVSQCTATACDSVGFNSNCGNFAITVVPTQQSGTFAVLQAVVTGGTAPYTYVWNTSQPGQIITVNQTGVYCLSAVDANGCVASTCYLFNVPGTDTICGFIFNDLNGDGIQDSTELGLSGQIVYAGNYTAVTDSFGFYQVIVPSGTYDIYHCLNTQGTSFSIPVVSTLTPGTTNCAVYTLTANGGTHCGYNFGIQNASSQICGKVFFDANNNGLQDQNTESGINGLSILLTSPNGATFYAYTNSLGDYCVSVPAGTYTITIGGNQTQSCAIAPTSLPVTAVVGQIYSNNNFAVYCQPGVCNLSIDVSPNSTVTPGFSAYYYVSISNVGSTVASGTANMYYDPNLNFSYSSPSATSHNASTKTISWNVSNLLPGSTQNFFVNFSAPQTLALGTPFFNLVNINSSCNDVNQTNNVDTIHQTVVGSWDPNNKLAVETNYDDPTYQMVSSINAYQKIEYIVNFQNTGTAPAVNVVILDELASDLEEGTFTFLGSSHPCIVTRTGKNVNYKFSNIMLPDSTNDEPNSHGFVKFTIDAKNGLAAGYKILDEAAIYFDFNEPVITNESEITFIDVNSIDEVVKTNVIVAPNPMSDYAMFKLSDNSESFRLIVTDLMGRQVADILSIGNTIGFDRNGLASGFYAFQILQNNKQVVQGKLVMQ